ncbi:MAG: galactokinase [Actinomycetota bacterium]
MPANASSISVRVPGRVNLIGDHTDYTGGLVLPMVVDLQTSISGNFTDEDTWVLDSDTHGTATIPLDARSAREIDPHWARYPAGVLFELRSLGVELRGFSGSIRTTLPIGSGLTSSAALEVATARIALGRDSQFDDVDVAQICRRAEHAATGVPCGIMDQLSIVAGRPGYATLIDCSTLHVEHILVPEVVEIEHRFIVARTLVGSEYSERVEQCRLIEDTIGPLRLASIGDSDQLPTDLLRRRARHVISENARVEAFARALEEGIFDVAGRLMTESHTSLAQDFGTSTPLMDAAVDSALREPGVLGARMTGGGFGGCIVILRLR